MHRFVNKIPEIKLTFYKFKQIYINLYKVGATNGGNAR